MSRPYPRALSIARTILRLLIPLNLVLGVLILALLIATLVAETPVMTALGVAPDEASPDLFFRMRAVAVVGILAVPLNHVVLTRLLAILDTVQGGDPFLAENAERLQTIAWAALGLELIHLGVGVIDAASASPVDPLDLDWSFSLTGWLTVLLLFVLAHVFGHGARLREDMAGTV